MIEEFWGSEGGEKILHLHFLPPFSVQSRIQTALTRKFLQVMIVNILPKISPLLWELSFKTKLIIFVLYM
jgi:hypothetical protein